MKNKSCLLLAMLFCLSGNGKTAEPEKESSKRLSDESFVVQTSDDDANASLNRISGRFDRGYASDEYVYDSKSHGIAGPFAYKDHE